MRIRGAGARDVSKIDKLFKDYSFKLDPNHLEMMLVAEDEDEEIIGVCSLVTILECTFITDQKIRLRDRVEALKELVRIGSREAHDLGYDVVHAFSQNKQVINTLKKHFEFQDATGQVLVKFTD
jgi:N-acetylglutamate synthase-like GNAT family acetyltransferase